MKLLRNIILTLSIITIGLVITSSELRQSKPEQSIKILASQETINQVVASNEARWQSVLDSAAPEGPRIEKEKADAEAGDKAKALAAQRAEASRLAKISADKAIQAEIDRIAAERADKAKQAQIAEDFKKAKAASDKAAAEKEAARLAEIESLKVEKVDADKLVKEATDGQSIAVQAVKAQADKLAIAVEVANAEADKLAKAEAAGTTVTEEDKQAKVLADQGVQEETDKLAVANEALKVANDKLAVAVESDKAVADKLAAAEAVLFQTVTGAKLAAYLSSADNISSVLNRAVALHNGDASNTCVYFSSEAMRRIGQAVPVATCNTKEYLAWLTQMGWVSSYDITKLAPGSICFTTNDWSGHPTHTFVFMGWVNSGDYTLANVADNQGNTVHVRNMGATMQTDAFAFYMHN